MKRSQKILPLSLPRKTKKLVSKNNLWDEHHNLITRGTTQIVPLLRNTTSDSSKPYSLTQNHGNAYWNPFSIPAQKGYIALLDTDSHRPSALCRHWQSSACLPHSLCFGLYHTKIHLSIPFLKKYFLIIARFCLIKTQKAHHYGVKIVLWTLFHDWN